MGLDYKDYKLFLSIIRFQSGCPGTDLDSHVHLNVPDVAVQNHHAGYDLNLLPVNCCVCCHQKTWKHLASLAQTTKTMKICQIFSLREMV